MCCDELASSKPAWQKVRNVARVSETRGDSLDSSSHSTTTTHSKKAQTARRSRKAKTLTGKTVTYITVSSLPASEEARLGLPSSHLTMQSVHMLRLAKAQQTKISDEAITSNIIIIIEQQTHRRAGWCRRPYNSTTFVPIDIYFLLRPTTSCCTRRHFLRIEPPLLFDNLTLVFGDSAC